MVNAKEKPIKSEKTLRAIVHVGQAVNYAVQKFVSVGEAIADDNCEIKSDMYEACKDARTAGSSSFFCISDILYVYMITLCIVL